MGGLITAALALALAALLGVSLWQRRRVRALAEQMEDFLTGGGKALAFSVHTDDLAPLHNAAAELENQVLLARDQKLAEQRATRDLTADISHQLKTPLASLRLFCEMDEGAHMDEALSQIERMERLIQSLLVLERMCAGGYEFAFAWHDAAALVRESWQELAAVYPDKRLTLEGSATLRCDARWLSEAFLNLLKNACEHTGADGEITVRMEATQSAFFCSVSDNGGGVDAKDLPRLFERFYRAQGRESKGAGIGLAIVQEIVRRHHGSIHAENIPGGLRMNITIPILNLTES